MSENKNNIWGGVISAGLGTVGQVLGGAIANNQNAKNQRAMQERQIEANKAAAERAYQQQKEMYVRSYNDTTYSAMRKQMEEAGLNPALMYGQGGSPGVGKGDMGGGVQAAGASGPTGAIYSNPAQGIAGPMAQMGLQMAMMESEVKLREAQADNLDADTEKKRGVDTQKTYAEIGELVAGTRGQWLDNELKEVNVDIANATKDDEVEMVQTRLNNLKYQTTKAMNEANISGVDATYKEATVIMDLAEQQARINLAIAGIKETEENIIRMRNQVAIEWCREANEDDARRIDENYKLGLIGNERQRNFMQEDYWKNQVVSWDEDRMNKIQVATIYGGAHMGQTLIGLLNTPRGMTETMERDVFKLPSGRTTMTQTRTTVPRRR